MALAIIAHVYASEIILTSWKISKKQNNSTSDSCSYLDDSVNVIDEMERKCKYLALVSQKLCFYASIDISPNTDI